jgi:hypothetical protein
MTTVKLRTMERLPDGLQSDESGRAKRESDYAFGRSVLDSYSLEDEVNRDLGVTSERGELRQHAPRGGHACVVRREHHQDNRATRDFAG